MFGLLVSYFYPVVIKISRQARVGEAGDHVPGEIDGIELDMGDCVQQGDPPGGASSSRHFLRRQQNGHFRPGRPLGRPAVPDFCYTSFPPGRCGLTRQCRFRRGTGGLQNRAGGSCQRHDRSRASRL